MHAPAAAEPPPPLGDHAAAPSVLQQRMDEWRYLDATPASNRFAVAELAERRVSASDSPPPPSQRGAEDGDVDAKAKRSGEQNPRQRTSTVRVVGEHVLETLEEHHRHEEGVDEAGERGDSARAASRCHL